MGKHGWTVERVDWEYCLYKKLSPTIDVEVSGLNNHKSKNYSASIFVWQIEPELDEENFKSFRSTPGAEVIETYSSLSNLNQVEALLLNLEKRYGKDSIANMSKV